MNYRIERPKFSLCATLFLVMMAIGMPLLTGCSNEASKTEATPAAATGAAAPPPGPGAPPAGAVAGGGVGQRINK